MADDDTLLGYLVPRYANVTENAATDALAYIMNRSAACMQSLNELVQPPSAARQMQPVTRVETQVVRPVRTRGSPTSSASTRTATSASSANPSFGPASASGQARATI